MPTPLLSTQSGERHFLLGNEAIVRGALEAGVGFVSCYPGTPSSEVPDTFHRIQKDGRFLFEYSVNEKVALEVGAGATLAGVPALVTMKHVGVNVAADPLMTLAYIGAPGGLVLLSADDPGCHSSQNEQDNRYYARLGGIPCLEPASAQEAKDMLCFAFDLSRQYEHPVMVRTTTRLNHLRGEVVFGEMPAPKTEGAFRKDPRRFVPIPAHARVRRKHLLSTLEALSREADDSPWTIESGEGRLGVITSGISRAYLKDVIEENRLADRLRVLELGMSYPLPETRLLAFLRQVDRVLVIEELEPILEQAVAALCHTHGLSVEVLGKNAGLPRDGEYSTAIVRNVLLPLAGIPLPSESACPDVSILPMRPPNLCAGCSHRATYLAVRQVFGDEAVYSSDIGCYTLGILPPLRMADYLLCMGSSIASGSGTAAVTDQPVVCFIGDSTFFHSGITGLINARVNQRSILVVVLDNRTTAMTGHQPNPGAECSPVCAQAVSVDVESIVRGCGVDQVRTVNPVNLAKTVAAIEELRTMSGVRVHIAREPCALFARKALRRKTSTVAYVSGNCTNRRECLNRVACPAMYVEEDAVRINPDQCTGCMLCVQVCKHIKVRTRSEA